MSNEIKDRAKDRLFSYIADCRMELDDKGNEGRQVKIIDDYIELIFSIPEIAIVDREAELPLGIDCSPSKEATVRATERLTRYKMLKAGWVKEIEG